MGAFTPSKQPAGKGQKNYPSIYPEGQRGQKGAVPSSIKKRVKGSILPKEKPCGEQVFLRTKQAAGQVLKPVPDPIKTGRPTKSTRSARKTLRRSRLQMRVHSQRQLVQGTKHAAKTAAAFVKKASAAAAKTAASLIHAAAGLAGGAAVFVAVCVVVLAAAIAASPFGIFFSGEPQPGAVTPQEAIRQINQEYRDKLEERKHGGYDRIEQTGAPPPWRDILSIFACKTAGANDGVDVTAFNPDRVARLRMVFWDMTQIETWVETTTHPAPDEDAEPVTEQNLHIKTTAKTAEEMSLAYDFNRHQQEQLAELRSEDNWPLWNELLYGISGTGSGEIVEAALSQVGNVGGEPYWSWYGYGGWVNWCACFVSWCAGQCGYLDAGTAPSFSACSAGIRWFRERGQWQGREHTPAPGDYIFFDWGGDGAADHVGFVERVENARVYTIEGNSNNAVRQCSYPLGWWQIFGYGAIR